MTGYLTIVKQDESEEADDDEDVRAVELAIPNREVARIFQTAVADHFKSTLDRKDVDRLISALWDKEEETASAILSDLLFQTISYMDYHEDYYHAFVAGVFTGYGYVPESNRER